MPDMPILPGLAGTEGEAKPTLALDDLTDDEFQQLLADATTFAQGADAPPEGEVADPAAAAAAEPAEPPNEDELAQQEADEVLAVAQAYAQELTMHVQAVEKMVDQAGETEDGDPKKVKKILKELEGLQKDADKAAAEAEKQAGKGDPEKTRDACSEVEELLKEASDLAEEAKDAAGLQSAPGGQPGAATAAPGAPAPAAKPKTPIEVWAGR